jgi:pimeloyl-ACP methyl ester carboxylesterase
MTGEQSHELTAADGLVIHYCLYGPEDGVPVIYHNGTPGTRFLSGRLADVIAGSGARMLVYDRPGYGGSARQVNRSIADAARDAVRLADAQGWQRFATWGASGGGPHALACGALLPERVTRCASVVGAAPFDAEGLDWFAGMSPGNVEEFTLAREGEQAYRPLVERISREAIAAVEQGQPPIPAEYELGDGDIAELRGRLGEEGVLERTRAAFGAIDGWTPGAMPSGCLPTSRTRSAVSCPAATS